MIYMGPGEHKLVPTQIQGLYKDLKHDLLADNVEDAEELFVIAKDKLLDVNHWRKIGTSISSELHLTDHHGKELDRPAHGHDMIRIGRPGNGDGHVLIDEIAYDDYPDEDYETFAMRLRSATNGEQEEAVTATFVIERRGKHLTAHYYGRNETANALLPVPEGQWLSLMTGLLQADPND